MSKVTAIQMCSSNDVDENLATAARLIERAVSQGSRLVVLPEMFVFLGCDSPEKVKFKEQAGRGHIQDFLATLALKHQVWIIAGTIPLVAQDPNKVRAACLVFDEKGHQVARYDKSHLFDVTLSSTEFYRESDTTEAGEGHAVVVNTPIGQVGLAVCFDMRFPDHLLALRAKGAEVIAIPAAFTVKTGKAHWALLMRCRAIDTFCYIVGAAQSGTHANHRKTYGHSMIVDPWGAIISEALNSGEAMIEANINLNKIYEIRKQIPVMVTL